MADDSVFRALADPTRREILDALFEREGQSLGELERLFDMTRFGVMKHVKVLEEANLVVTRKVGRSRLHYLNPVPIREIHDRWTGKFAAQGERSAAGAARRSREGRNDGCQRQAFARLRRLHQGDAGAHLGCAHAVRVHAAVLLREHGRVRLDGRLGVRVRESTARRRSSARCSRRSRLRDSR